MTEVTRSLPPMESKILNHLQVKGSITPIEAEAVHRCRALPRRIATLKERGYPIRRELHKDLTGQRYARYFLVPTS